MKKAFNFALLCASVLTLGACFNDNKVIYEKAVVEFQDAVVRAPALGKTYPLIAVANGIGQQTLQINLVGAQRESEQPIKFSVNAAESTAKEGIHYQLTGNTVTIPAKSSFGTLTLNVLKAPAAAGTSVTLVLVLDGNGSDIGPNENYRRVGYRITL